MECPPSLTVRSEPKSTPDCLVVAGIHRKIILRD
jgi:hypothetical protein